MRIVWDYFGHMRAWDGMRRYVRLDLGKTEQPQGPDDDTITLAEAQYLVARMQGFESWESLSAFAASVPPGKTTIATKWVAVYGRADSDAAANAAADAAAAASADSESKPVALRSRDWDEIIAVMQERRLPGLHATAVPA